jgi:signal transduction histidine kinase
MDGPVLPPSEERLRLLGQLAGAMSHEIHNPLNAILLHADILEEELYQPDGGSRDQLRHSLTVMKTRLTQLYDMVQEYLALARLSTLVCEPEDLGALLEAFALEIRECLAAHGIAVQLENLAGLGQVALHKPTFWRALEKIVQHTMTAMPQGGVLTLRGRRTEAHAHLEISDTGSGMTDEQWQLLLQPSYATGPEGSSLGLYLVGEVMAAHQGQVAMTSTSDCGTTLTITLPLITHNVEPLR